jgi:hypothetical protein
MATVIRVKATVLPGGRVEVTDPTLPVGQPVDVVVTVPQTAPGTPRPPGMGIADWLLTLPPGPRSADSWEEFERLFQEERDSWDR